VHLRDRRLGELPQVQDRLNEQVGLRLPRCAHDLRGLDEIRVVDRVVADRMSRAETLAVGLENQNLDVVVAVGVQQRGVDFFGQLLVLGVRLLRPVQRDLRDGPLFLVDDSFAGLVEIHCCLPFRYDVMTPISAPMS
jgi:hypothetical protein